jgi:hypothetical protein
MGAEPAQLNPSGINVELEVHVLGKEAASPLISA